MTQLQLAQQSNITEQTAAFFEKHNIRYILNSANIGYYTVTEISLALNLEKDDFSKNFIGSPSGERSLESNKIRLLEGESLKQFKAAYLVQLGPLPDNLKFTSKLLVCTLEVASEYIFNSRNKDVKQELNKVLNNSLQQSIISENLDTSNNLINPHFTKEIDLHMALIFLASMTNIRLYSEESVADITSNKQKHRRLDMVNIKYSKGKKIVTIYELKSNSITLDILTENLNKHYLELARCHYKTPYVKLVYIAPNSPEQAALDLLAYSPDVSIMLLKDFTNMLLKSAAKRHRGDNYFVKKLLIDSYPVKQLLF
jgi:hypothetical protein